MLRNIPRIRDVDTMLALLADLGAEVDWLGENEVRVHARGHLEDRGRRGALRPHPRARSCSPARCSRASATSLLSPPGGDFIGRRPLDTHVHAFEQLGAEVDGRAAVRAPRRRLRRQADLPRRGERDGNRERGHGRHARRRARPCSMNAACEPHVQDLCRFLVSLGAQIDGIGSNMLRIDGVERLSGGEHRIGPEHIEAASFIGLAAVTGGDVTIEDIEPRRLRLDPRRVRAARRRGRARRDERARAARPGARDPRRPRRPDPEDRGRPVAGVPRRPDLDRARGRDAGDRDDPDLREDVREPPVLRRQARPDGRADHPLRPAPRRRDRPGEAPRRSGSRARTSAPGWRC